jgi:hypothetical protein
MQQLHLSFVQDPSYSAGFGGRWNDEMQLQVRLHPLVRERAEVNPCNWDLSQVPAINTHDGRDIDLGQAIQSAGSIVWDQLGPLNEQQLPAGLAKPLKDLGVPRTLAEVIAEGINLLPHPRLPLLGTDADLILEGTPAQFVELLNVWVESFRFGSSPSGSFASRTRWRHWRSAGYAPASSPGSRAVTQRRTAPPRSRLSVLSRSGKGSSWPDPAAPWPRPSAPPRSRPPPHRTHPPAPPAG